MTDETQRDRGAERSGIQLEDPLTAGPRPPFPTQEQEGTGRETAMEPQPDYGEESYIGNGRLKDRVALVTGADSGIGRAVVLAFAREGADVVISYLDEGDDAQATVRIVEKEGRRAVAIAGDIGDEAHCRGLVERTVAEFGRIDILVNNAAFQQMHESIEEFSTEEWDRTLRTNLSAMFFLCREAIPRMPAGSAVINVASVQAYQPSPQLLAYATTKGGIVTFTQALAQLVAKQGIRVNAVAPGPVWTPLIPATSSPEAAAEFGADTPLGRPAQPAELAPVFVLLASPEASYITGSVYSVTGGAPIP